MLTLLAEQPECLWDDALPMEVKELPEDLAALDVVLSGSRVAHRGGTLAAGVPGDGAVGDDRGGPERVGALRRRWDSRPR